MRQTERKDMANACGGERRNNLREAKSMLRRAAIVLAVALLAVSVVASPILAGNKTYSVDVDGDVDSASFETPGNNSATRLNPDRNQSVDVILDRDGIGISTHQSSGVCGNGLQDLNGVGWQFHNLSLSKSGSLHLRFRLKFSGDCGFDDYELNISFDTGGASGPDTYVTSEAHIVIRHYAETADDPTKRGNKRISHTEHCCNTPFFETFEGEVTITITELP